MATLIKTGTLGTGSPLLAYELYAEQTAASGTSRTVKVTAKFKVNGGSSSYYSYPCNWRARVGSSYGAYQEMKSNTKWSGGDGYRTFSQTIKVDVGTTSSTSITVGLEANHGTYKSWNGSATGSFTVGSTNTAPTMSGYITCRMNSSTGAVITAEGDGPEDAVKIPENVSSIYVSWPAASDKEGGTIKYELYHQRDNGSWVVIYEGTATNYTHKIGTGNQGSKYDYYVKATDNGGLKSNTINATQFMKNNFTGNTISSTGTIKYTDSNSTLRFTYSGEKNTATLGGSNGTFTRTLTCNGITVYNNTITKSPIDLTIYKEGTLPSGPYVKFEDLKNKFAGSSYKGTLTFVLTTNNAYGSSAASQMNISTNLQTNPVSSSNIKISRDKNVSTAIKTTSSTKLDYFLPDGSNVINVSWNAGRDKLGGSVSYDLYYSIGGGTWQLQASGLTALSYNHTIAKLAKQQTLTYMVKTKTSYETYVDAVAQDAVSLEFYNAPALSTNSVTRSANGADISLMVKSNSSILNIETVGTWSCRKKGTTEEVSNGRLSITQKNQVVTVTNLTEDGTYDLVVTFNDNTGFSVNDEKTIAIAANSPIFFVNKYGIGVNGEKADRNNSIAFKGSVKVKSPNGSYATTLIKSYEGDSNGMGVAIGAGGLTSIGGGESATNVMEEENSYFSKNKATEHLLLTSDNHFYFVSGCQTIANKKLSLIGSNGSLYVNNAIYESAVIDKETGTVTSSTRVYSPNNKPSLADLGAAAANHTHTAASIGAAPASHTHSYLPLSGGTITGMLTGPTLKATNQVITPKIEFANNDNITYDDGTNTFIFVSDDSPNSSRIQTRKLVSPAGQNIDIVTDKSVYFDVTTASGIRARLDGKWSGSKGTEPSFYPNATGGWGYIGGSGQGWYRIYGSGGSVSDRNRKYDISKADTAALYENVKDIKVYNYRTVSDICDDEGNVIDKHKRSDLMLGCMVDELPLETVFYDEEGGDGKAVDMYSYTSMILGALKEAILKIEQLENEVEEMRHGTNN